MCKVSVVIPVYNTEKYLAECLDSVKNQTLKEVEIICVDDGSTDGSCEILQQYMESDSRFMVLENRHKDGAGAGAARNLGLSRVHGKYIIFLDSDDFFELTMLEEAYTMAEKENAEAVIFDAFSYDNKTNKEQLANGAINKDIVWSKTVFENSEISDMLFQVTWGGAWNILFSRQLIDEKNIYFQEMRYTDDMYFTYLGLAEAKRIAILNKPYVHYRVNLTNNQSANRYKFIEIMYEAPVKIKEELDKRNLFEQYKVTFWNRMIPHMIDFLNNQNDYRKWADCYYMLKDELFRKLNLNEYVNLKDADVVDKDAWCALKKIHSYEPAEYLFYKNSKDSVMDIKLPSEIFDPNVNLIIYGAGKYGRACYGKIIKESICQIIAWVDRNYLKLGFPVQNPKLIRTLDFDYILIGIKDRNIVREIRESLKLLGVTEDKIIYLDSMFKEQAFRKDSIRER